MIDRLLQTLTAPAWLCDPRTLKLGVEILNQKVLGENFAGHALHAEFGIATLEEQAQKAAARNKTTETRSVNIKVVPIFGVIEGRASSLGTSSRQIDRAFTDAMNSRDVDAILLDVASPGGVVTGIPELADKILDARNTKPVLAFTDQMAASAAYWLAAGAIEFWSTRTAETGSIGVYMLHVDQSEALEKEGLKVTAISAGKFKLEGNPFEPLSKEAESRFKGEVDEIFEWFLGGVAAARNSSKAKVRDGFGEGRVLMGQRAKQANLVDKVGTFEDALERLVGLANKAPKRGARTEHLRRRMALRR